MDSINRQQAEQTHENLQAQDAIKKVRELIKQSPTCFFCTAIASGDSNGARPMSVQKVDDEGNLWFLSAIDSHKDQELMMNPAVTLYFQGSAHSDFLQLNGTATLSQDKAKIKELWQPIVKNWFTQGMDDPRITVIKVKPTDGYYWDTKHGHMVAGMKMMIGAMLGKTMDDSIEGKLDMQ